MVEPRLTSGAVGQGRQSNRVSVTDSHCLHVWYRVILLELLGPLEHDLVVAIVASDKQEVRPRRHFVLVQNVLCGSSLVKVNRLDDYIVTRGDSLDTLLLTRVVDVVRAITSVARGCIWIAGLVVPEEERAMALLDAAALNTLKIVLKNRLNRVLPLDRLLRWGIESTRRSWAHGGSSHFQQLSQGWADDQTTAQSLVQCARS